MQVSNAGGMKLDVIWFVAVGAPMPLVLVGIPTEYHDTIFPLSTKRRGPVKTERSEPQGSLDGPERSAAKSKEWQALPSVRFSFDPTCAFGKAA